MPISNIDPTDVFPRRNLPGAAEQWGRAVENRVIGAEEKALALSQDLKGINRSTASQFSGLSDQVARLAETTRVVGMSFVVSNQAFPVNIAPGGSLLINRPDWATHAIVEFTAISVTDFGDMTGEVAVQFYFDDQNFFVLGDVPARMSASYLVDGNTGSYLVASQPLIIEVPSGTMEWNGIVSQTITGSGSVIIQTYVKVTWITRGLQTTGDI